MSEDKENGMQGKINKQKLWNFNQTYKSHSYLKVIFSMFVSCLFLFSIDVNSVFANDTNLIQGNVNLNQQTSKKLYEGHFVKLPKLNEGYIRHTSTLLPNGSVLITRNKNVLIFDPKYNKFTESTKKQLISSFSRTPEALLMADNNVLILGNSSHNEKIEIYNTKKEEFELYDDMKFPYPFKYISDNAIGPKFKIISDDKLFLYYRKKDKKPYYDEYYLYDYINSKYKKINYDTDKYGNISKIIPYNDKLLIFNGYNRLIEYSLKENKVTLKIKLPIDIYSRYNVVKLDNKLFFFTNGNFDNEYQREKLNLKGSPIYVMDLDTNEIIQKGSLKGAGDVEYVVLKDNRIMFNSGRFNGKYVNYEIYDTKTNKSTFTESMVWHPEPSFTLLNDGSVLIVGGRLINTAYEALKYVYRYYPNYNLK